MSATAQPSWREHGYFEVYVPIWDGRSRPVNLTIDVVADEETIDDISLFLYDDLAEYGADDTEMMHQERTFGENLGAMLDANLIWDASCSFYGIGSVEELEELLDSGEIEVFPLY